MNVRIQWALKIPFKSAINTKCVWINEKYFKEDKKETNEKIFSSNVNKQKIEFQHFKNAIVKIQGKPPMSTKHF